MSANNLAPIIIKRKKIVGGDAHHGGAWKVAYADFVTAMMAFFLLMWLLNATTESQRKGIADYFNPSIPLSRVSGGGDGSFGGDSVFTEKTLAQNGAGGSKTKPTAQRAARGQLGADARLDEAPPAEDAALAAVEAELMGHGGESMSSELDMRHVITRLSDEGLVVEVFDLEGEPLFDPMTHEPTQAMKDITALFATVFQLVTNKIAINGHVSSRPVVARDTRIWDTSTMRAQIVRGLLETGGLPAERIHRLTGYADRQLVATNPLAARNNRLEFILIRSDR